MSALAVVVLIGLSTLIFWVGMIKLLFIPLSLYFEIRQTWRNHRKVKTALDDEPLVSIIVPGYNEEKVLGACISSILASSYQHFELIMVNDGSTDSTAKVMRDLAEANPYTVIFVDQQNSGKGAALNTGTAYANGEFIMYVDSDGVFGRDTIRQMLKAFDSPKVGAVSGDDRPVNLDRVQTTLLALISHVGTGFIRRALAVVNCLPVVSGNNGLFRLKALKATGPLRTDTLGEDLELTWRIHRAGYRVNFAPQATRIHKNMICNPHYGAFGAYLLFNLLSMIIVPVAQIFVLLGMPIVIINDPDALPTTALGWVGFLGLALALVILIYSIALNRAWGDLRHIWVFPLWPIYSTLVGFTLGWAIILEVKGAEKNWNKLERTGTISVSGLSVDKQEASPA